MNEGRDEPVWDLTVSLGQEMITIGRQMIIDGESMFIFFKCLIYLSFPFKSMQVNSSNPKNIDYNKGYPVYRIYCRTVGLK